MTVEPHKPEILITMSMSQSQIERLKGYGKVRQAGWGLTGVRLGEDELCRLIRDTDVFLVGYENVTRKVIQSAVRLGLIGVSRSNPVNVDIEAANEQNIPVLHAPGRNAIAAAEFTIGLMICQARHIDLGDRCLRTGEYLGTPMADLYVENPSNDVVWDLDGVSPYMQLRGVELAGRTLGLIGLGNVASRVAKLAQAFGMKVITHTPLRDLERAKELSIPIVPLQQLLNEADFISVHCNVNSDTHSVIDAWAFSQIKPSAYIINTARASIIDQAALVEALKQKRIAGAALDVFWYEPLPSNHPLLAFENVTLTPHLAGSAHEVPERHSRMLADDVIAWLEDRPPMNVFNKEFLLSRSG
mgnify:FL=1